MTTATKHNGMITAYVAVVDLAALALLALYLPTRLKESPAILALLLILVAVLGMRPVRIRSLKIQVAALDLFILSALVMLDPLVVPLVALVGVIGAVFGPGRRPFSIRTAFNLGVVPLSASLAALTYVQLAGERMDLAARCATPMIAASAVFFLVNTFLAALAIAMEARKNLFTVWFGFGPSNGVSTLASMVMAIGLAVLVQTFGPAILLIGLIISIPILAQGRLREVQEQN
jgi:hypothetical protein